MTEASNEGMIETGQLRFFYREWSCSSRSKDRLVLLHGSSRSVGSWEPVVGGLREHFDLLAIDLRGHGYSAWDPKGDYSTRTMAKDVSSIVSAFGFESFSLLGHSMGGRVAIACADIPMKGLRRLIIEDIRPQPHSATWRPRQERFSSLAAAKARFLKINPGESAEGLERRAKSLMRTADGQWTWLFDRLMRDPEIDRGHMEPDEAWAAFAGVSVPTLVVRGESSTLLTHEEALQMAEQGQCCEVVTIAQAGHGVHLDQPERFVQAVSSFLLASSK